MFVNMGDGVHGGRRGVAVVLVLGGCKVWIVEDHKHLVFNVIVDIPVLFLQRSLLRVIY